MENKKTPTRKVVTAHHDYDREYREGAHWDKEQQSGNIPLFMAHLRGGEKILDAGCGTGRDTMYLAQKGFHIVGIDQSEEGIRFARERAANKGIKEIAFDVGTIETLPYENQSFDAIYSGYVLGGETFPLQIKELGRVLKPGGVAYIAMFTETKYETPNERDEVNPKFFIHESLAPCFDIVEETEDSYSEEDDAGKHTHDRIRLILQRKRE